MSNQQKKNTFYGAAAILTVSTILVKIIGAIFKIPLIAILPEEAYGDFNGAYNIYSFFLTISTAGLPVALSKTVSECHTLGRENQKHRVFRVAFCAFLFMGLFSFLCMSVFGQLVATYILSLIHTEPTRRTPISYAVFCLKKKKNTTKKADSFQKTHISKKKKTE